MASYTVDIQVALKGAQKLDAFNKKIRDTAEITKVIDINMKLLGKNNDLVIRSFNSLSKAVGEARKNFNEVAIGTSNQKKAAEELVAAEKELNKALAEQQKLLDDVSGKTAKKAAADNKNLQEGLLKLERKSTKEQEEQFLLRQKGQEQLRQKVNEINQQRQEENKLIRQNVEQTKKSVAEEIKKKFSIIAAGTERRKNLKQSVKEFEANRKQIPINDRINAQLKKRGLILSSNGRQIIKNNTARSAGRRGGRFQNALASGIIGGGFPLLFGQGPTAALGGALGGLAGGAIGGQFGFALSIAGTTIGSALDNLANALAKPTENIQLLVDKLGLANTPTGDLALRLEKVGLSASAADLLLNEFGKKFGKTPEDIKKNTEQMTKFKNQVNELGTAITLLLSKVLSPAIQTILNFIGRQSLASKVGRANFMNLELEATGLAKKATQEEFGFGKLGFVEGPLAGPGVEEFFKKTEQKIFQDLINKSLISQGKSPVFFKDESLDFDDEFKKAREKVEQAEFNKNIRSLEQSLKLEKDRLNISSEQFTLKQEQFKLDNLNADLELLKGELGKNNNDEIQRQIDGLQAQKDLQEEIVKNAKALADPFKQLSQIIEVDIGNGIKDLIKGTRTLSEVMASMLNKMADAFLNLAIFGNIGGQSVTGGLLGNIFKANGGSVKGGNSYIVGERGPELFTPGVSGMITPNHALGGGTTVVVNVDASGSNVEGDEDEGRALGIALSSAIETELIKQKRPGGLLA